MFHHVNSFLSCSVYGVNTRELYRKFNSNVFQYYKKLNVNLIKNYLYTFVCRTKIVRLL